jgi:hypothetical protein
VRGQRHYVDRARRGLLDHLAVDAAVKRDREVGRPAAIGHLVDQPVIGEQVAEKADLCFDVV